MAQSIPPLLSVAPLAASLPGLGARSFLAIVLPELLEELALERCPRATSIHDSHREGRAVPREGQRSVPRAIVLAEDRSRGLEPTARIDAVNGAARRLGVSPRQTIAQATAMVESLVLHTVPPASVSRALQQVAEAALGFGSPVAFQAPDTVWVDVSGTSHLFGGTRSLALLLAAHIRALGHSARIAVASGPSLARAFARHADFDETGVFLADSSRETEQAGSLPIGALPISSDTVAWFARLGLLTLDELRKLPRPALAARLGVDAEAVLELIYGRDAGVLDAYHPEELPFEQQSWDTPLESIEPLLFVLKGLCARLASRLEGRGQAARELLLTIQYDKSIAALRRREQELGAASPHDAGPLFRAAPLIEELKIQLGSPLAHAEELERIARARLQRETLLAPACGLRLQVTSITEARHWQLGLNADVGLGRIAADPSLITVLMNELSADVGDAAVGVLETHDSHLLEKSSGFVSFQSLREHAGPARAAPQVRERALGAPSLEARSSRLPTRLINPIELDVPLEKGELIVLDQRGFVVESVRFVERLESVEWWASKPVSRDYFRLWLSALSASSFTAKSPMMNTVSSNMVSSGMASTTRRSRDGLEVLVYLNRDNGKKYVQAIYD
jgi:protein ImuB